MADDLANLPLARMAAGWPPEVLRQAGQSLLYSISPGHRRAVDGEVTRQLQELGRPPDAMTYEEALQALLWAAYPAGGG